LNKRRDVPPLTPEGGEHTAERATETFKEKEAVSNGAKEEEKERKRMTAVLEEIVPLL